MITTEVAMELQAAPQKDYRLELGKAAFSVAYSAFTGKENEDEANLYFLKFVLGAGLAAAQQGHPLEDALHRYFGLNRH